MKPTKPSSARPPINTSSRRSYVSNNVSQRNEQKTASSESPSSKVQHLETSQSTSSHLLSPTSQKVTAAIPSAPTLPSPPSSNSFNSSISSPHKSPSNRIQTQSIAKHDPSNPMTLYILGQSDLSTKPYVELWLGQENQLEEILSKRASSSSSLFELNDTKHLMGEEVLIELKGAVFNKKSKVKMWWLEGRIVSDVIEVGKWPLDPRPVYCTAYITRRGEAYCKVPFVLGYDTDSKEAYTNIGKSGYDGYTGNTGNNGSKKVISVLNVEMPFWPRSLHRDCDVPCTQRYDEEPISKWETTPNGKYALLIAADDNENRSCGRVADAQKFEKILKRLGYGVIHFYGTTSNITHDIIQYGLQHCLRPAEPSKQIGRGGWWAGGSRSAEVLAFISVPYELKFKILRKHLLIGSRSSRPYYLQGYSQNILNRREMLTSRILMLVDNVIIPTDYEYVKGNCTEIQMGSVKTSDNNVLSSNTKSKCVPMLCGQNISVQCLSMPYQPNNYNDSNQSEGEISKSVLPQNFPIQSIFVKCLIKALAGDGFQNKLNSNYITASDICNLIEKYSKEFSLLDNNNDIQLPYIRETSAPRLVHIYPNPVVHPDVENIDLQLWFRRTKKNYKKVLKERKNRRKEIQMHNEMSHHGKMLKEKIDTIKAEMLKDGMTTISSSPQRLSSSCSSKSTGRKKKKNKMKW